jgi:hypothetical protein
VEEESEAESTSENENAQSSVDDVSSQIFEKQMKVQNLLFGTELSEPAKKIADKEAIAKFLLSDSESEGKLNFGKMSDSFTSTPPLSCSFAVTKNKHFFSFFR